VKNRLQTLRSNPDARRTALISSAEIVRLILQASFFFLLAGILGVNGFGQYAGTAALVGIVQPLASWGSTDLLLKHVSRDHLLIHRWLGTCITVTSIISISLGILLVLTAPFILGSAYEWEILVPLLISDLVTLRVVELGWASFLAVEHVKSSAMIRLTWATARIMALIIFASIVSNPSPAQWALSQSLAMGILSIFLLGIIWYRLGRPTFLQPLKTMSFSEGFAFAIGSTSETIYGDADKTLLVRMTSEAVAGTYTIAYRLVTFAYVPVAELVMAKLTTMFRAGHGNIRASLDHIREFQSVLVLYALLAAVGLVLIGPLIPLILGNDFAATASVLFWLALMPAVQTTHRVLGAVLMTSGHAKARGTAQAITAVLNVILSAILISYFSWQGAVMATYASEILLAAIFAFLIRQQLRLTPVEIPEKE
jgi:O-antigen/teichoic acid export membrane protein